MSGFRPLPSAVSFRDVPVRLAHGALKPRPLDLGAAPSTPGEEPRGLGPDEPSERSRAREEKRSAASVLHAVPGAEDDDRKRHRMAELSSAHHDLYAR